MSTQFYAYFLLIKNSYFSSMKYNNENTSVVGY